MNGITPLRREQQSMLGSEFTELATFAAVARSRSYRDAARRLGVNASAVSRTISRIESRLGVRLLNRTTRSVSPTEAGALLYERLLPLLAGLDTVLDDVVDLGSKTVGVLRLNLPRVAAELILLPLLPKFNARFPDVRLELTIDDGLSDIVGDGFDAGIRIGSRLARDMIAVRLGADLRNAIVGSPSYFERYPPPSSPQDLRHQNCLNYRWSGTGETYQWRFATPAGEVSLDVSGGMTVNDTGILLAAARGGQGLACLPEQLVAPSIAAGELVRVLERYCPPFPGFFLYHPSRTRSPPPLRALLDFVKADTTATNDQ